MKARTNQEALEATRARAREAEKTLVAVRAENHRLREAISHHALEQKAQRASAEAAALQREVTALRADNARLRAALQQREVSV